MESHLLQLGTIGQVLDSLTTAVCVFDHQDRAVLWNRTFLVFFPEHEGRISCGEPYLLNLRRFYEARLEADELPLIDRFVEEALVRHQTQQRPYFFEHGGRRLKVASLPLTGVGRIRMWTCVDDQAESRETSAIAAAPEEASILASLQDGVMLADADGRIAWVNEAFTELYAPAGRDAILGHRFEQVFSAAWATGSDDDERYSGGLAVLVENMRFAGAPFEIPLPAGRWCRISAQPGPDKKLLYTHIDVTAWKRQQQELLVAEQRMRASNALLEATLERMQQGVMMVNAQRIVEVCNRSAVKLLDLPESLMASQPSFEEVLAYQWSTDEFKHTSQSLQDFVRAGGITDQHHLYERTRPDGRIIEVQSVPIEGGGVLRTYTDISDRKRAEERIRHVARHDGLTGLVNRDVFCESLAEAMAAAERGSRPLAVHYIDLDRFKPINDRFGHAIGDRVLATVARRLRSFSRGSDVVARMGGDEFAVIQIELGDVEDALGLARRILCGLAQPMRIEGLDLNVGASIGIARYPGSARSVDALIREADEAMYAAKSGAPDAPKARIYGEAARAVRAMPARAIAPDSRC